MDRMNTEERLALAERHVADGAERIRRHIVVRAKLARGGDDEAFAMSASLLAELESAQAVFVADRERLAAEVAARSLHPQSGRPDAANLVGE